MRFSRLVPIAGLRLALDAGFARPAGAEERRAVHGARRAALVTVIYMFDLASLMLSRREAWFHHAGRDPSRTAACRAPALHPPQNAHDAACLIELEHGAARPAPEDSTEY